MEEKKEKARESERKEKNRKKRMKEEKTPVDKRVAKVSNFSDTWEKQLEIKREN